MPARCLPRCLRSRQRAKSKQSNLEGSFVEMLRGLAIQAIRRSNDRALYVETKTFSEGAGLCHSAAALAHANDRVDADQGQVGLQSLRPATGRRDRPAIGH